MTQAVFCTNCSNPLREGQKFCIKCGAARVIPSKIQAIDHAMRGIDDIYKSRSFNRREIKELPNILWEDELPEQCVTGTYKNNSGVLVATDRRMLFVDKGFLGQLKVEDFPYDKISSIESNRGILLGSITIYASGNQERIDNIPKAQIDSFVAAQRDKISSLKHKNAVDPSPSSHSGSQSQSVIDELEKIGKLHQQGILTDDEFEQAKARLLRSI